VIYVLAELKWKTELGREQTQVIVIEKLAFTLENPVDMNSVGGWITGHKQTFPQRKPIPRSTANFTFSDSI